MLNSESALAKLPKERNKFSMYAIIQTGGKQYKVSKGDQIEIEKIDASIGDTIQLKDVMMIVDDGEVIVGKPTIEDAVVFCHVVDHVAGKKVYVFKSKRRKGYHRKIGHRQKYTKVQIDDIAFGDSMKPEEGS